MINLRFHIVSIVAIFLALAIGMLAGSTLLDRATIDVLKGRQKSLDSRNSRLRAENDELREAFDAREPADAAFGDTLDTLVPGLLRDGPMLVLATRGIDEASVRAIQEDVRDAGGSPLGIVWFDSDVDLDDPDALARAGEALGLDAEDGAGAVTKDAVVGALSRGLASAAAPVPAPTTTLPGDTGEPPADAPGDDALLDALAGLADAELVEWESPNEGEPGARLLPDGGLQLVLVSGEGTELRPGQLMYPLARALAQDVAGVVVAEVRNPRTDLEAIDDPDTPERGWFVNPLRRDDDLSQRLITIDNLEEPFGRLALVLALSRVPLVTSGDYGVASTTDQPFPPDG